jgi:glycosyltransferase involved in cell wall biosynthesis
MNKINSKIGVVTFPISDAGIMPLSNLIDIVHEVSTEVYLITGGTGGKYFENKKGIRSYQLDHRKVSNLGFNRATNYIRTQILITIALSKLRKNVNSWLFFTGAEGLALPILIARFLGKKVVIVSAGSSVKSAEAAKDTFTIILTFLQYFAYRLAHTIVLYSQNIVGERHIEKFTHKIVIAQNHFIDIDRFKITFPLTKREKVVAFVGRLSEEKGILNFLKAVPIVIHNDQTIKYQVIGDGQLLTLVKNTLENEHINDKVSLTGWTPHEELPKYLNRIKLLVIPSFTEGLPNIMLEAMACGTPVLATPVGAIPDIIKDGETGFIMADNTPECIAINILRVLTHSDLDQIAKTARSLVENEFTYENAVLNFREILNSL